MGIDLDKTTLNDAGEVSDRTRRTLQAAQADGHIVSIDLVADEYVTLNLTLQPTLYRLKAGHQLGVILYGTDFEMTVRGNQDIRYTIDTTNSQLLIPIVNN
ncbi:HAD hydrolase family protein [Weissella confusa]|uniref:HAD hydrolase family protein n=1 Tax=Weissella confusa TaxID=1583 RepID=A0A923NFN0_WEICO|nr:HAD hydrolase family protein [Weissella confusa]